MRVYLARLGRWGRYSGTFRTGQVTGGDDGFTLGSDEGCGVAFPFAAVGFHWLLLPQSSVLTLLDSGSAVSSIDIN